VTLPPARSSGWSRRCRRTCRRCWPPCASCRDGPGGLQRILVTGEIRILRSRLIPDHLLVHGFPERTAGVSHGLRSSLNLGFRWGDEREHVEENRRRVAA